jgi:hypothetical protein
MLMDGLLLLHYELPLFTIFCWMTADENVHYKRTPQYKNIRLQIDYINSLTNPRIYIPTNKPNAPRNCAAALI